MLDCAEKGLWHMLSYQVSYISDNKLSLQPTLTIFVLHCECNLKIIWAMKYLTYLTHYKISHIPYLKSLIFLSLNLIEKICPNMLLTKSHIFFQVKLFWDSFIPGYFYLQREDNKILSDNSKYLYQKNKLTKENVMDRKRFTLRKKSSVSYIFNNWSIQIRLCD